MPDKNQNNSLPAITVNAVCLPEAWEQAVIAVYDNGLEIKTAYDRQGDPLSKDATVMVVIEDPFAEPRIHKNFPGGPIELEAYRQEVVDGIHDHWIDPAAGKWTYTYHERLFNYCVVEDLRNPGSYKPFSAIDQIDYIINNLCLTAHSRRAQAITWMPTADGKTDDPPCLQRIWCRLTQDKPDQFTLNMNTHWRSRDLYKAWFMNVYALTDLQRIIAETISQRLGKPVRVGRYVDISDSLHIYGKDLFEAKKEVEKMKLTTFADRAWDSGHPAFEIMTMEAKEKLQKDPDWFARAKG